MKPVLKNIVVAVNGSESSVHAAMYGIILAKQLSLNMKAVFVTDAAAVKFLANSRVFTAEERDSYLSDLDADGKKYLAYVSDLAKSKGLTIQTEIRSGSVWAETIHAADEFKADMILIGGGSTAQSSYVPDNAYRTNIHTTARMEIATFANCPVLVVHKERVEDLFKIL